MAETEEPLPPQTLFEIMKYGRTERTVVVGALRMPQSLTSMEGDMPTPRAKVVKKDVKFNDKLEVSSAELQVATAKEKEPSSTDSPKANENLKDAEDHANKETTDDMTTPKQSAQHVQHTQQSETKTFEEKTRFSKVVPPTGLISSKALSQKFALQVLTAATSLHRHSKQHPHQDQECRLRNRHRL